MICISANDRQEQTGKVNQEIPLMVIRTTSEMRTFRVGVMTQHMQVCLWFFYFMYLNPRRIHRIASWQLKMSFCKVAVKLVL